MPLYESVYIARPDISGAQAEALTEGLSGIVAENGGKVEKAEYWGLKTLAYKIKKSRKGHYTLLNIDAPPDAIKELERNMRINEDVLRYLTVRVEKLEEGPSAMMQSRGSRDDRGGRRFGRDRDRGDRGDRGPRDRDRDAKPADARPADAKAAETKPAEAKPDEAKPAATEASEGSEA